MCIAGKMQATSMHTVCMWSRIGAKEGHWGEEGFGAAITSADQFGNMAVAGHLAVWDLLDGAVDGMEESLGFVASWHYPREVVSKRSALVDTSHTTSNWIFVVEVA